MCLDAAELFHIAPWHTLQVFKEYAAKADKTYPIPTTVDKIAQHTSDYEAYVRKLWEAAKSNPTKANILDFIDAMVTASEPVWRALYLDLLDLEDLLSHHYQAMKKEVDQHIWYLQNKLFPDLLKEVGKGLDAFNKFDYRVIFMYSGALWSSGMLATVMFDGLEFRDLADLFLFSGPNDSATCTGLRGCDQHVGKIYTVAEILTQNIIPGKLACYTNCRHMLIPIASPLNAEKRMAGKHNQKLHGRLGQSSGGKLDKDELLAEIPERKGNYSEHIIPVVAERIVVNWSISDEDLEAGLQYYANGTNNKGMGNTSIPLAQRKVHFVHGILKSWSGSSGQFEANALMAHIADKLGLDYELPSTRMNNQVGMMSYVQARPPLHKLFTSLGDTMYGMTQDYLSSKNITELTLYRGQNTEEKHATVQRPGKSYAFSQGGARLGLNRELVIEKIPAYRIFSIPITGMGTMMEREVVVMPNKKLVNAEKHMAGKHPQASHDPHKHSASDRVFSGQPVEWQGSKLSKLEVGVIGEQLAMRVLSEQLGTSFTTLNEGLNNAPIDVAGDHLAVEVKTGLASNGSTAQHWRATIGQPGKAESELISLMTREEKAAHNQMKSAAILERKAKMLAEMSAMAGSEVRGMTVGVILHPDGKKADMYRFDGFHLRIPWNKAAEVGEFMGSYDV